MLLDVKEYGLVIPNPPDTVTERVVAVVFESVQKIPVSFEVSVGRFSALNPVFVIR
jgi:hypothetical protein